MLPCHLSTRMAGGAARNSDAINRADCGTVQKFLAKQGINSTENRLPTHPTGNSLSARASYCNRPPFARPDSAEIAVFEKHEAIYSNHIGINSHRRHLRRRIPCPITNPTARSGVLNRLHGSIRGSGQGFLSLRRWQLGEKKSGAGGQVPLGQL